MATGKKLIIVLVVLFAFIASALSDEIHEAAKAGELDKVKSLLKKAPELVNAKDQQGRTPLHWACRGQNYELLAYLVEKGADVNALDNNQTAPLHSLAVRNGVKEAELLINKGADVNILTYDNQTPLHFAASYNQIDIAALLVEKGAKLELRDNWVRTPLVYCARERGGPEMTKLFIQAGADVNASNEFGETALSLAAWRGKEEVVNILLDAGAEVPVTGTHARSHLMFAASRGLENLFNRLDAGGADLSFTLQTGGTLLHEAAGGGSVEIIQKLIGKGLDLKQKDQYGWTPLHYAVKNGRENVVSFLIQNGADIDARTIMGQSPFNVAVEYKQDKVRDLLVAKEADQGPMVFPVLEGAYLGQKPPGDKPEVFALGIVSSIWGLHSTVAFSPDCTVALWAPMVWMPGSIYSDGGIYMMTKKDNRWTPPETAPFCGTYYDGEPFFAPDGKSLYFISNRPLPGIPNSEKERIWFMDKTADGWSEPKPVDPVVNERQINWHFSLDAQGHIYFGSRSPDGFGGVDIYCAKYEDGRYTEPRNLGPAINTDKREGTPYIAPDGKYLIFQRDMDLFISFRKPDGTWSEAKNMGMQVNSPDFELCPMVTPDGKYLFFLSNRGGERHAWWVDAKIIDEMREK